MASPAPMIIKGSTKKMPKRRRAVKSADIPINIKTAAYIKTGKFANTKPPPTNKRTPMSAMYAQKPRNPKSMGTR